jgi:hypothetical protein
MSRDEKWPRRTIQRWNSQQSIEIYNQRLYTSVFSGLVLLHNRIWTPGESIELWSLDTSIPFGRELSKDPVRVLTNVESRFWGLIDFFYHMICYPSETLKACPGQAAWHSTDPAQTEPGRRSSGGQENTLVDGAG